MEIKIKISKEDEKCLLNDLLDINEWVQAAVKGKINNCKSRLLDKYRSPLLNKTDSELIKEITSMKGYKNRKQRDAEQEHL